MNFKTTLMGLALIYFCTTSIFAQDNPEVKIGGALRFNYNYSSWKDGQKDRGGDFGFDVFRINAKAKYKGLKLNAEYRFYSSGFGGDMLKQGWIGYDFNESDNLQVGLTQVPFGITQYNSHSWFFSMDYYVGLEDDHDMGIKFTHKGKSIDYAVAFFKNAEELSFGSNSDVSDSRYAYDVGSYSDQYRNKEVNQLNGQLNFKFGDEKIKHMLGVSGEYGGLYNLDTKKTGSHYAAAIYYQLNAGKFDLKAQAAHYKYDPKTPSGESDDVIAMTAYGAPYLVASEATVYTIGAGYTIPTKKLGPISSIQIYNDFGLLDKNNSDFTNSMMNDFGALVTAGSIYTYIDFAAGKNQPWLGNEWTNGLGDSGDNDWEMRFNVNIGYYF